MRAPGMFAVLTPLASQTCFLQGFLRGELVGLWHCTMSIMEFRGPGKSGRNRKQEYPRWCPTCDSHENCKPEAICESESSPPLCAQGLSLKKILTYASQHLQAPCSLLLGCWEQGDCTRSQERASQEGNTGMRENARWQLWEEDTTQAAYPNTCLHTGGSMTQNIFTHSGPRHTQLCMGMADSKVRSGEFFHLVQWLYWKLPPLSRTLESQAFYFSCSSGRILPCPFSLVMQRICSTVTLSTGASWSLLLNSKLTHLSPYLGLPSPSLSSPLLAIGCWEGRHIDFSLFFISEYLCIAFIWHLSQTSAPQGYRGENGVILSLWLHVNYALAGCSISNCPISIAQWVKAL